MLFLQLILILLGNLRIQLITSSKQLQCSEISVNERLDCYPELQATKDKCVARGCCWKPRDFDDVGIPACYLPHNYPTYNVLSTKETDYGFIAQLSKSNGNYSNYKEIEHVQAEIIYETSTRLRFRVTIPSQPNRWEPFIPLGKPDKRPIVDRQYNVSMEKSPFGLKITRVSDSNDHILDFTGIMAPALIVSDQFLQISYRIFADKGYGIGETETAFPYPLNNWLRFGLWAHDGRPMPNTNLYGVHNFFMGLNYDGRAFGLFFLNSNAQEVAFTPLPSITYRTIGGILDFFLFTGPGPTDVIAQYYALIGHPPIPPYWSLGFHLCRYGHKNLSAVKNVLQRNLDADIPIDAQWFDIDYMKNYKVWSVDETNYNGLSDFIENKLRNEYGIRTVLILDPAISTKGESDYAPFKEGLKLGLFINDSRTGKPISGTVWPGETVFPDFSHPSAGDWWYNLAKQFYETKAKFDGLWIDMNEPANFNAGSLTGCPSWNNLDNPSFIPNILYNSLFDRTVCPSALHYDTTHYNRHNLYGYDEARVTYDVLTRLIQNKRPFLLSRSTFAGSGRFTAHWSGDVVSTWKAMRASIIQTINFNMFAMPMVGADVCGFSGDSYEELCIRWSQLGAFYPFSRNHNADDAIDQDPAAWSPNATRAIKDALKLRYHLLPYLYTLFYRSNMNGTVVARALAFEYPEDLNTHYVNEQFMLGSCILVTPVLDEGRIGVVGYLPKGEWINLSTAKRISSLGENIYFSAPLNVIPIFIRAGCVIPFHTVANRTSIARKQGFSLIVVMSTVDDGSQDLTSTSSGELFWDDGENNQQEFVHIQFNVANHCLNISSQISKPHVWQQLDIQEMALKCVIIIGLGSKPKEVMVHNSSIDFIYYNDKQMIHLDIKENLTLAENLQIEWKF